MNVATNDKPIIDPRFIREIEGKQYVLYAGILSQAHQMNLNRIEVEILQYPTSENHMTAICKAVVESKDGDLYVDIGDANENNCNPRVVKHLLRMASTRAKARALRDFTNIGMTCLEELETDVIGDNPSTASTPTTTKTRGRKPRETVSQPDSGNGDGSGNTPSKKITEAQRQAILNLSRRRGLTHLELERLIKETYKADLTDLTTNQASALINSFQRQRKSA